MRRYLFTYNFLLLATILLSFTSCIREYFDDPVEVSDRVMLELFTRLRNYDRPLNRAGLANETTVDTEPYILVFKENSGSFIFEEAVKSYRKTSKTYAILKKQTDACKLLILANPQVKFYKYDGVTLFKEYDFTEANLNEALNGETIENACNVLYTNPLNNPETDIPFTPNKTIPMSYIYDVPNIQANTTIGTGSDPLELKRIVAKVIVENKATNFILEGITAVFNAPMRGTLHNLSITTPPTVNGGLAEYRKDINYSGEIAAASSNTTLANPVYLFESGTGNNTYIIIKGIYQGQSYYYKMALVNSGRTPINIMRNNNYLFTITMVSGIGHDTPQQAIAASVFNNTEVHTTLTVTDTNAFETIAFDEYYLSVSNSHYMIYGPSTALNGLTALTLITEDKGGGTITGTLTATSGITVTPTTITASSSLQSVDVKINITSAFQTGEITIKYGNIKKIIKIEKKGTWATASPNNVKTTNTTGDFNVYCVSGIVDPSSTSWIKLHPSYWPFPVTNPERTDTDNIIVDDGVIKIERTASGSGTGTFYLSTIKNPGTSGGMGENASRRIKVDIVN
ncbi:hypothetical protein [Bacteroides sp. 51]|uniref:hypothetical protein n=1 Tax=Bacteroides sp. 51 TaxID=2302938 RepID=UPI0013D52935|nr:hypothetical protein [Bacteroides sp. 51]NDV82841.1 hypothetical protein [Bacteroides sp. 51]